VGTVLDSIADTRKAFVVDFAAVPFLDSTAADAMSRVATKARRQGIRLFITGASPTVRRVILARGVTPPRAKYRENHCAGHRRHQTASRQAGRRRAGGARRRLARFHDRLGASAFPGRPV